MWSLTSGALPSVGSFDCLATGPAGAGGNGGSAGALAGHGSTAHMLAPEQLVSLLPLLEATAASASQSNRASFTALPSFSSLLGVQLGDMSSAASAGVALSDAQADAVYACAGCACFVCASLVVRFLSRYLFVRPRRLSLSMKKNDNNNNNNNTTTTTTTNNNNNTKKKQILTTLSRVSCPVERLLRSAHWRSAATMAR
jgi:hypothetical protein